MKAATRYLVLLSMLVVGCGDSNDGDGDGSGSALKCDAVGWCTSWSSNGEPVKDAPALTGGTLSDGLYRMERGHENSMAMLIKGKSILLVGNLWGNLLGTWKVEGERLVISVTSTCDRGGDEAWSQTTTHAFAVKGDVLYTQEDLEDMPVMAWRKVESLCDANASFNCKVSNCACEFKTNPSLMEQTRCF